MERTRTQLPSSSLLQQDQPGSSIQLNEFDVLGGREKAAVHHTGNKKLRFAVSLQHQRYHDKFTSRKEKIRIIDQIVSTVYRKGGRFLRRKQGQLQELSLKESHAKVGHAFRDMAAPKTASRTGRTPQTRTTLQSLPLEGEEEEEEGICETIGKVSASLSSHHSQRPEMDPLSSSGKTSNQDYVHEDKVLKGIWSPEQDSKTTETAASLEEDEFTGSDTIDDDILHWLIDESNGIMESMRS